MTRPPRAAHVPVLSLALVLCACGGSEPGAADGGASGPAVDAGVAAPVIPWLDPGTHPVVLTPCPPGWREVADGDLARCEPYPEAPPDCAAGEALFPGSAACEPVGDPCPAGDFAEALPDTGVLYVLATAAPGGNGSRATPYASLAEVRFSILAAGTTVAIGKGTYDGALPLRAGVRVVGACAAETFVRPSAGATWSIATVASSGEPASLRGLTLRDAPTFGVFVDTARSLIVDGVIVEGGGFSVGARDGAVVTGTNVVLRGAGRGVSAEAGGQVSLTRAVIEGTREVGVAATDLGTRVTLADTAVRDGMDVSESYGGIHAQMGAVVEGTRVAVTNEPNVGAIAVGMGSEVALVDAVVRGMHPLPFFGHGLEASSGGLVRATRVVVSDNTFLGIEVADAASHADLHHVVVQRTGTVDADFGYGLMIEDGATLDADALVVADNHVVGVAVLGAGSVARVTDAVVRGSLPSEGGIGGRGVEVSHGGHFAATRMVVRDVREAGLFARAADSTLALEDVIVTGTRLGVTALGYCVSVQEQARATATRLAISDCDGLGLAAFASGVVQAQQVTVREVTGAGGRPFGHALAAVGAGVDVSSFVVSGAAGCGLIVTSLPAQPDLPALDARSGLVERVAVGACIQVPDYDLTRLQRDVSYVRNGTNLAATSLPVPDLLGGIGP